MEEEDEIQAKLLPRVGEVRRRGSDGESTNSRFHSSWHHHNNSSRIIRVSRASGGKDRHSKVMTSKGLRDRRVRLSVTTAIQFYDLQDRLGYDQPSKAVEWLIKSASDSISELPSLNNFPHENENENEIQINANNNNTNTAACSSTSETSKGSGLSLSRSDIRVKARERARVRTAKEKERDKDNNNNNESHNHNSVVVSHHQHHPVSKTASFTELLTGGINSNEVVPTTGSPKGVCEEPNRQLQWCSSAPPMDHYFLGASSSRTTTHNIHQHHQYSSSSSGFSLAQIQMGHEAMNHVSAFNQNHSSDPEQMQQQQQQFSFIADHQGSGNDYNLNFTMSSGLAGYNRGTLQSNSPSLLPQLHLQRFSPNLDGSSTVPFFFGAAAAAPAMDQNNNNHQFSSVFDGSRLQLYYADGCRHSDQKGKTKN